MNSMFFIYFLFFRNTDESAGSKDRKKDHERIPDLTVDITHTESYSQSIFLCEVKSAVYMLKHLLNHPDKMKLVKMRLN